MHDEEHAPESCGAGIIHVLDSKDARYDRLHVRLRLLGVDVAQRVDKPVYGVSEVGGIFDTALQTSNEQQQQQQRPSDSALLEQDTILQNGDDDGEQEQVDEWEPDAPEPEVKIIDEEGMDDKDDPLVERIQLPTMRDRDENAIANLFHAHGCVKENFLNRDIGAHWRRGPQRRRDFTSSILTGPQKKLLTPRVKSFLL